MLPEQRDGQEEGLRSSQVEAIGLRPAIADGLVYADLNYAQKTWLKKCILQVRGIDLPEGLWQVTIMQGRRILMRDLFEGSIDAAEDHGRKLAYRAALGYGASL